jgi:hypothetical protein
MTTGVIRICEERSTTSRNKIRHSVEQEHVTIVTMNLPSTVTYLLKARTVQPQKQPLLANGSETTFVSRQRPLNIQRNGVRCEAAES